MSKCVYIVMAVPLANLPKPIKVCATLDEAAAEVSRIVMNQCVEARDHGAPWSEVSYFVMAVER